MAAKKNATKKNATKKNATKKASKKPATKVVTGKKADPNYKGFDNSMTTVKEGMIKSSELKGKKLRINCDPSLTNHREGSMRFKALDFIAKSGKKGVDYDTVHEKFGGPMIKWFVRDEKVTVH